GLCKSLVELEFFLEEVYKATTDQLDWVNPKGTSSCKYTTSVTKTNTADYEHIKWIEDLVPRTMWIQELVGYDKHALWGISHWGRKHQQFYGFAINRESARDVYSKSKIIAVTELKIVEWHNYKHLDWVMVRSDDDKLYKFKEGDFKRLHIQYIKDMLLLLVQGKLTNLTVKERFPFNVSLRMFTRSIVVQRRASSHKYTTSVTKTKATDYGHIKWIEDLVPRAIIIAVTELKIIEWHNYKHLDWIMRHVEDLQLGIESYQKKLNLTKPDTYRSDLKRKEAYIAYSNPRGFIYQNKDKQNRSILTDLQVTPTKLGRMKKTYSSHRFIANCFNAGNVKMEVKEIVDGGEGITHWLKGLGKSCDQPGWFGGKKV
nr:hypothetical protein [Tanacetum cinerariifolium]